MLKQVYEVTEQGFIKDIYVAKLDEQENILFLDSIDIKDVIGTLVMADLPNCLYKPRWNGTEWIEGATQEEIDELTKVDPITPTADERINALEEALLLMMMEG